MPPRLPASMHDQTGVNAVATAKRRLDPLGDCEPGRDSVIGPEADNASGFSVLPEQQPRRLNVMPCARPPDPGPVQRHRFARDRIGDERNHAVAMYPDG